MNKQQLKNAIKDCGRFIDGGLNLSAWMLWDETNEGYEYWKDVAETHGFACYYPDLNDTQKDKIHENKRRFQKLLDELEPKKGDENIQMKATEFIKQLADIVKEHGDLEIVRRSDVWEEEFIKVNSLTVLEDITTHNSSGDEKQTLTAIVVS